MPSDKAMRELLVAAANVEKARARGNVQYLAGWEPSVIREAASALDERDALQISFGTARQLLKEANESLDEQARAFNDVAREVLRLRHHHNCVSPAYLQDICGCGLLQVHAMLAPFILPEPAPDVLTEATRAVWDGGENKWPDQFANELCAEIARRGGLTIPGDA